MTTPYMQILFGFLGLLLLYVLAIKNYLLFHSLTEIFSIFIAGGIFLVAWHCRRLLENHYLLFLGIAYLFIAALDTFHTLSYKGMGIFNGHGANLPTQLWIAARYVESITLFLAPLFLTKRLKIGLVFSIYLLVVTSVAISVLGVGNFPDCYIDGEGLTTCKKISEYIISMVLAGAVIHHIKHKAQFDPVVFQMMIFSIMLTIAAELAFTFYISVYGISNMVGHFFKIISFYLIYRAVINTSLTRPFDILFRNLNKRERELDMANKKLSSEIVFRKKAEQEKEKLILELKQALSDVKQLSGLLPICCSCKKIRDDKGYWNQIESYITARSDVDFSHGICPICAEKLYPDLVDFRNNQ